MTTERDELARVLRPALGCCVDCPRGHSRIHPDDEGALVTSVLEWITERYTPKPAIVTTPEELDALPKHSIVLDAFGATCTNVHGRRILGWRRVTTAVADGAGHWHSPYLPATVLYRGDA